MARFSLRDLFWLTLVCTPLLASCSGNAQPQIVGKWKHVRQNGEPVQVLDDQTGILEFRSDGTTISEEVMEIRVNDKLDRRTVKPLQGKYRFISGNELETEGEDRGKKSTTRMKAFRKGNVLRLDKPYGQVDEFELVP